MLLKSTSSGPPPTHPPHNSAQQRWLVLDYNITKVLQLPRCAINRPPPPASSNSAQQRWLLLDYDIAKILQVPSKMDVLLNSLGPSEMVGRVGRLLLLLLLLRLRLLLLLLLLLLRRLLLALLPLPPGRLLPSLHLPSHYSHHLDPYAGTGTVFLLLSSGVGGGQDLTLLNRSVTFRQRSKPKPAPPAAQIPALRPKLHQPPQPRDTVVPGSHRP